MPSFKEVVVVITTFVVLATASGRGDLVFGSLMKLRYHALRESKKDWGCPSIFSKNVC